MLNGIKESSVFFGIDDYSKRKGGASLKNKFAFLYINRPVLDDFIYGDSMYEQLYVLRKSLC